MAKTHELVFKIDGLLGKGAKNSLSELAKTVTNSAERLKALEKVNLQFDSLRQGRVRMGELNQKIDKAKERFSSLDRALSSSKEKTEGYALAVKRAQEEVDRLSLAVARHGKANEEENRALSEAKVRLSILKRNYKESAQETKTLSTSQSRARSEMGRLTEAAAKQQKKLDGLEGSLQGAGYATDKLGEVQQKVQGKMGRLSRLSTLKSDMASQRQQVMGHAMAFTAKAYAAKKLLGAPLQAAMDAEETMAGVAKMVDFDSVAEKGAFEQAMRRQLSTEIPMAFTDYGELIASAAGAGIGKEELLSFGSDAAKMSIAMDISAGEAGEMMAKWRSAFGMGQEAVLGLADRINDLGDNSAAKSSEIAGIVSKVGALGELAGLKASQVAALGASMVTMGVQSDVAATGIKKISTTLTKGKAATKSEAKAFEALGLSAEAVAASMQEDAAATITDILSRVRGLDEVAQTSVLTQLFGQENVQAVAPLLNQIDLVKEKLERVQGDEAKGSLEREFESRKNTTAQKLQLMKNKMGSLTAGIGKDLLPVLDQAMEKIGAVIDKVMAWREKNPELFSSIVKVAASLVAFTVAMSGLRLMGSGMKLLFLPLKAFQEGKGLMGIVEKISSIGKSASKVFGVMRSIGAFLMANPYLLAIAAVAAAVFLLVKHWDTVKAALVSGWNFLAQTAASVWGKIRDGFVGAFQTMKEKVKGILSSIAAKIRDTIGGAISWVKEKMERITSSVKGVLGFGAEKSTQRRPSIPVGAYAKGGIVTRPTLGLIGEGKSAEAVIPLEKNQNSLGLWERTGAALGVSRPSTSSSVTVNFTVHGDAQKAELEGFLPSLKREILRAMEEAKRDQARRAFS